MDENRRSIRVAHWAAAVWIFGGAAYFYIHFTGVFYRANESAIGALWDRIVSMLTIG